VNYLALVNDARVQCGVSNAERPLTTLSSPISGENARIKTWIDDAWIELQTRHDDWEWMWEQADITLTPGIRNYLPAGTATVDTVVMGLGAFGKYDRKSFRFYSETDGQVGEGDVDFLDYVNFRELYLRGAARTQEGRPACFTVDPKHRLVLSHLPPSTEVLHITFDYWRGATHLVNDADIPAPDRLDEEYHKILVYRCMEHYAGFDAASEVYARGKEKGDDLLSKLEGNRLPTIGFGPPLA